MLFPAEIIDILKVLIILVCCYAMSYVDTSMLYHMIKSQSVIKLYLMYNMIEVADRLFRFVLKSSFSCPFLSNFSGFIKIFQVRFYPALRFGLSSFLGSFLSNCSGQFYPVFQIRFHSTFQVGFIFNCNKKNVFYSLLFQCLWSGYYRCFVLDCN